MNLLDLLEQAGGGPGVASLAGQLGIDETQARKLIGSISPALASGLQKRAQSTESGLVQEVGSGKYRQYLEEPDRLRDARAREEGNHVLEELFGDKETSRNVADCASEDTGLDSGLIRKALPMIAGLAMGALGKKAGQQGGLGGLGSLAGLLDTGGDGRPGLDDLRRMF